MTSISLKSLNIKKGSIMFALQDLKNEKVVHCLTDSWQLIIKQKEIREKEGLKTEIVRIKF